MLALMTFGSLMTIATVSLDEIAADLGSNRATLTWMITGLMLTMAIATPLAGKVGDIKGHRRLFLIGLATGAALTLASALAWNATSMITLRVLYGMSGALVVPNGMALMVHAYGPRRRASAMGWFQFAMTGAPTAGLVVGGPMIDVVGWRWVFVGFALVSAVALLVGLAVIRPGARLEAVSIDYAGATALGVAVLAGLLAITRMSGRIRDGSQWFELVDGPVFGLTVLCVVAIVAFIQIEGRSRQPMLKLQYFRRRSFTLPMVASSLAQFAYMGGFVVTPAMLVQVYGLEVGLIALMMAPRPAAFSLSSPLGGYLATHWGERQPIVLGGLLMVVAMIAFAGASMMEATPGLGLSMVVVGLLLTGLAAGVSQPAVASAVVGAVDPQDLGIAGGMSQQMMFIGVVTGIQTLNVFVGDSASSDRFAAAFVVGGVVASVGLLAGIAMPRLGADQETDLR